MRSGLGVRARGRARARARVRGRARANLERTLVLDVGASGTERLVEHGLGVLDD